MHLASRSPPHLVSHSAPQFLSQLLSNAGGRTDRRNTPWLRHTHRAPTLREAWAAVAGLQQELGHLGGGREAGFEALAAPQPQDLPARGSGGNRNRPLEEIRNPQQLMPQAISGVLVSPRCHISHLRRLLIPRPAPLSLQSLSLTCVVFLHPSPRPPSPASSSRTPSPRTAPPRLLPPPPPSPPAPFR